MKKLAAYSLMLAAFSAPGAAQTPPDQPIDAATRQAVVRSLGEELRKNYVFPEVAEQVSKELSRKERAKAYDSATTARAFAEMLHADLQELAGILGRIVGRNAHDRAREQAFVGHRRKVAGAGR